MKKILKSLLFLFIFVLTGCDSLEIHTHTFSSEWISNESNHWHNSTCGHENITSDLSEHEFNEDNKCSVCGYEKIIEPETYVVNFINTFNKEVTTISIIEGNKITPIDDPSVDGYTFNGWVDKDDNSFGLKNNSIWSTYTVNKDLNLYSSFIANKVNLTISCDSFLGEFDINIDNEDYINEFNQQVDVGTVIKLKAKPKDYAIFNKWKDSSSTLSEESIYTFTVTNKDYNITVDFIGKEYNLTVNEINCNVESNLTYKAGDLVSLNSTPTVDGFTFNGYYDEDDNLLSDNATYSFRMPGKNYQITAKTLGNKHKIILHLTREGYSHVIVSIQDVEIEKYAGEVFILKPTELTGYTCMSSSFEVTMPDADLEYTIQYKPIEYSITYCNIYGGEYTGDNKNSLVKTYTVTESLTLSKPVFSNNPNLYADGFGWYLNSDCSGEPIMFIPSGSSAENLVLYAKVKYYWSNDGLLDCKVKYVDDTGKEILPQANLGRKAFNELITGYDVPTINGYELVNNGFGSRMIDTSADVVFVEVTYKRCEYDINYVLIYPNGRIGMISVPPSSSSEESALVSYKYGSTDTLNYPKINEPSYTIEGLYLDHECSEKVTQVDPTWTGRKQIYIKLINK